MSQKDDFVKLRTVTSFLIRMGEGHRVKQDHGDVFVIVDTAGYEVDRGTLDKLLIDLDARLHAQAAL